MMLKQTARALMMAGLAGAGMASATVLTLSGKLDDPLNTALVGSSQQPAVFTADPLDSQQNVALHGFSIAAGQSVRFQSLGFGAGGIDPYVSLFQGSGNGASFLQSFFGSPIGDFDVQQVLAAGDYTVAIGVYSNLSFAENLGVGTLGDGFTGLGGSDFGNGFYELLLTTRDVVPVPEPGSLLLALAAIAAAAGVARRAPARTRATSPG